ncbi:MAG: hypothetical protein JWQ21_2192 [Herminiimonas sp.]|nr:hypothetical protein [Herminiimonas sp.]
MAVEHFGKYQLEFVPLELAGSGQWAPYLIIRKFDEETQDFKCVFEKQRASGDAVFNTEIEAVNEARRMGNALIEAGRI